jgi:hypothetical protein
MNYRELSRELKSISREVDMVLANEQDAAAQLDERFTEQNGPIKLLLKSVQDAKIAGLWRNTRFNLFDVMGCPRREEAHSGFLAWVLDPDEAHGFGDAFLREFMRCSVGKSPPSTSDLTVLREYRCGGLRFDIHVEGDRWCLIVENKIDALPMRNQCNDYQEHCARLKARGKQAMLVYVTPSRKPPGNTPWISYGQVRRILESLVPAPSAASAIKHFCEHIISNLEA